MCVKKGIFKKVKTLRSLILYTHTHTHTHTHVSVAKKFFARQRKITTVFLNGGLIILTFNKRGKLC